MSFFDVLVACALASLTFYMLVVTVGTIVAFRAGLHERRDLLARQARRAAAEEEWRDMLRHAYKDDAS